ncbi:Na/Pi cotransporter family protein [[Ruminococcus] gnavus]|uniref:Na/Pi cotransporter family protein n=1 Tax=Mediterraneibacter gnavus TaxID=33038 RepID=UPI001570A05F|nr:Na/Pi cotransporter family protein [Mediterraneibacter gnavus]NSI50867.1 Na/Pi cotransporter family protein [Mediterraneibacter gnavus]
MDYVSIILPFIGGLGMFIYGMQIMAQGLENAAGSKMKSLLEVLTKNKFFGVLLGAFITAVIQSSSATTVMVVGFVNAGIMNLTQAMGVIMGANIGTTVTGWLVSSVEWAKALSPANIAPVAVMIGVIVMLTGKRRSTKDISSIIVGFGILFIGITTMSDAVEPLQQSEAFCNLFVTLGHSPFLGIVAGALVTAVIQSSSASVGILQSLAVAGLVPFNAAVYIIMGQNIGTCVTAIMSSIGAKKTAKTAAVMHLLFNIIGTIIFSVVAIVFFKVINPGFGEGLITQTEISTVHTIFNIGTTILLFPVSDWIIKLAKKLEREDSDDVDEGQVLLDDRMLETPSIALQSTVSEMVRMGHVVRGTMDRTRDVLITKKREEIEKIREEETIADGLCKGITEYAIKLNTLSINEKEHQEVASILQIVSDIERVSDYCENISEFAENLKDQKASFSEIAREEIQQMEDVCIDCFRYAIEALEERSKEKAMKVIEKESQADELEIALRTAHMKRLARNECSTESGIVFLDALVCLERISDHARNIAEEILTAE